MITHYLWCDLETTGTEEQLDSILEMAVILTTPKLEVIEGFERSWLMTPSESGAARLLENSYVFEMHITNGLLHEISQLKERYTPIKIQNQLFELLFDAGCKKSQVRLAGSGTGHFDMRFLRAHMPALVDFLAYRPIDIGTMRTLADESCGFEIPDFNDQKTHRAMDDVRLHLQEARWWRHNLMGLFERIHQ